jgi:hypothetical protein
VLSRDRSILALGKMADDTSDAMQIAEISTESASALSSCQNSRPTHIMSWVREQPRFLPSSPLLRVSALRLVSHARFEPLQAFLQITEHAQCEVENIVADIIVIGFIFPRWVLVGDREICDRIKRRWSGRPLLFA